mgnify:CR=1 FL=1
MANLAKLKEQYLSNNRITDITPLVSITNLEPLEIRETQVTDVTPIAGLNKLTELHLKGNKIAEGQQAMLKKALPNCKILF